MAFDRDGAIYVVGASGDAEQRLTGDLCESPASASEPAWSPDGAWIAFTLDGFGQEIFVMRPDGSEIRRSALGSSPSWSPSGDRIAFTVATDGYDIHTVRPDGSDQKELAKNAQAPVWSRDGRVAFARQQQDRFGFEIHVVNIDGTGEKTVARDVASTPDGDVIAPAWVG